MKNLLIILFLFFSNNVFSLEYSKPLWDQTNYLICIQKNYFSCFNQECEPPEISDTIFLLDFKNNKIIFPGIDAEREIIANNFVDLSDHFENIIITKEERIVIEFKEKNIITPDLNFMRITGSFPFGDSNVFVASGVCKQY